MKSKEDLFESREVIWRSYRDEISKEASKFSASEDKRLQKIKKEIKVLDPTILDSINVDIGISSGVGANINFSDKYSKLSFSMDGVDEHLLEDLNNAVTEANGLKEQDFVIDKDYQLLDLQLPREMESKETLKQIDLDLAELSNDVQFFPTSAQESLYVLDESVKLAKKKKDPISAEEKVSITAISNTTDVKWAYFSSFGIALVSLLVIIIMVILIVTLW